MKNVNLKLTIRAALNAPLIRVVDEDIPRVLGEDVRMKTWTSLVVDVFTAVSLVQPRTIL